MGKYLSWYYSDKLEKFPPNKPDDDLDVDEDAATDEEDPESQESHGWLESGKSPPKEQNHKGPGSSNYQGKSVGLGATQSKALEPQANCHAILPDLIQEVQNLAIEMQKNSKNVEGNPVEISIQEELSHLGFVLVEEFSKDAESDEGCVEDVTNKTGEHIKEKETGQC
jgi:hypothetical protein